MVLYHIHIYTYAVFAKAISLNSITTIVVNVAVCKKINGIYFILFFCQFGIMLELEDVLIKTYQIEWNERRAKPNRNTYISEKQLQQLLAEEQN